MFNDAIIITASLILTGIIYGTISGCAIVKGSNRDRGEISQLFKLFLIMAFPLTLSAIGSAKLVIWMMEGENEDEYNKG